jgi:hypothetical protein
VNKPENAETALSNGIRRKCFDCACTDQREVGVLGAQVVVSLPLRTEPLQIKVTEVNIKPVPMRRMLTSCKHTTIVAKLINYTRTLHCKVMNYLMKKSEPVQTTHSFSLKQRAWTDRTALHGVRSNTTHKTWALRAATAAVTTQTNNN